MPKRDLEVDNCNYCGKSTKVKFGNTNTEKTFCSRDCYVADGNKIQKGKCRIAGCSQKAYYECMDLCLGHSKPCKGGKIKPNGKICNAALGIDEGDICGLCENQTERIDKNENSRNCSYCEKLFKGEIQYSCAPCGTVYCSKNCCEASAPQCKAKRGENNQDNQAKPVKFVIDNEKNSANLSEKSPGEGERCQTLIINLKSVRRITLTSDSNLVIEFNKAETNSNSVKEIQVINDKQIASSQELQKVKSYLLENGEKSINQQRLNSILNSNITNSELTGKPDNKLSLVIGLSIIAVLTVGLASRLLIKRKVK